ncbi:abortive infection system antitoxin AbiGi family protein [Pseudomonas capsici]|uniref:abortive infection system antitoxin AbiGi family protein n=1 Tax=Pseudomonas capsici TaxID=2810614 RepID=UPI0021F122EE|nr:abortive infection system antitoxin AbiGi family protein [Pseudomonas capsici]MCV4285660.1 abortive infection system antitoxin AbiGi family protein [Pseudomonas capsici]
MNNDLPFFERPDLSPYLVHLTRRSSESNFSAFENLVSILLDGRINGSTTKKGFIKGSNPAACFMDIPLNSLKYVLNEANTDPEKPRYEPYGIVVTKKTAYKKGCRPVIYLSDAELKQLGIADEEKWRVVRLEDVDGTGVNWIHEREWRCKGSFSVPQSPIAVLVKNSDEAAKLQKIISKQKHNLTSIPKSIIPLSILCQGLPYMA